jgi:hypothetical protein
MKRYVTILFFAELWNRLQFILLSEMEVWTTLLDSGTWVFPSDQLSVWYSCCPVFHWLSVFINGGHCDEFYVQTSYLYTKPRPHGEWWGSHGELSVIGIDVPCHCSCLILFIIFLCLILCYVHGQVPWMACRDLVFLLMLPGCRRIP